MRFWITSLLLLFAVTSGTSTAALAQQGDAVSAGERAAILNALRPEVTAAMQGPVEFVVELLEVQDGWALVWAQPQRPGGAPIDPATVLSPEQLEFTDSIRVDALLRLDQGTWTIADYAIGATDVWYACYPGAPAALTGCETGDAGSAAGFPSGDSIADGATCYLYLMIASEAAEPEIAFDGVAMQQAAGQWRADLLTTLSDDEVDQLIASDTNFRLQTPAAERNAAAKWCVENAPEAA